MLTVGRVGVTALREAREYFVWQGPPRRERLMNYLATRQQGKQELDPKAFLVR